MYPKCHRMRYLQPIVSAATSVKSMESEILLVQHHTASSGALSEDRDLPIVPAEQVDVLLDPLESHLLIQDTGIRHTFTIDFV